MNRSTGIEERLAETPVVPLVQAEDPATAVKTSEALVSGGLTVVEVVMRTDSALRSIEAVRQSVPRAIVGAGTVLNKQQALAAVAAGAQFIVSPGLDDAVVAVARKSGLPVFPGVATATEVQHAWNLGLRTVKFFPAGAAGGTATIKALSAAFRDMRFVPTGGVSADNLAQYLALPSVLACGGSWLTPAVAVEKGDFGCVTKRAAEAVRIAASVRRETAHG